MAVRGVDGLRVVDASSMPYVTNGNIYAPVVMLAEKAADLIRGDTPLAPLDDVAVLPVRAGRHGLATLRCRLPGELEQSLGFRSTGYPVGGGCADARNSVPFGEQRVFRGSIGRDVLLGGRISRLLTPPRALAKQ